MNDSKVLLPPLGIKIMIGSSRPKCEYQVNIDVLFNLVIYHYYVDAIISPASKKAFGK
jgi:hypothetical protein